jgi:Gas vesicle protein
MRDHYDREEANVSTKLTYLLIGGGIGAIVALLFAPKSGTELRATLLT